MPRKDLEGHKLSPLTDPESLHRQEVKAEAELKTACQSTKCVPQLYTEPLGKS